MTRKYNGVLASNNYKNIAEYIEKYKLKHIDTGKILMEALEKKIITESDGNNIWEQMIAKRRMLPADSFTKYLKGYGYDHI